MPFITTGAREELVYKWDVKRLAEPDAARIISAHTKGYVRALNGLALRKLNEAGELSPTSLPSAPSHVEQQTLLCLINFQNRLQR